MAVGQDQTKFDFGHNRAWGAGELKEKVEGDPFYTLLAAGMDCGGQTCSRKEAPEVAAASRPSSVVGCRVQGHRAVGAKPSPRH